MAECTARAEHSSPSQPTGTAACHYRVIRGFRFLVASPSVQDLLLSAKHLFGAASYCAASAASYRKDELQSVVSRTVRVRQCGSMQAGAALAPGVMQQAFKHAPGCRVAGVVSARVTPINKIPIDGAGLGD